MGVGVPVNSRYLLRGTRWSFGRAAARLLVLSALALAAGADAQGAPAGNAWRIDEAHTWIGFKINAVGFPTTRGHFTHYSGRILIDFDNPAKSFTNFTVYSASVDVGSPQFTDFVRSPAILDVAKYPLLTFSSTQVEKLNARTARVTGNLTMLGVSKPITLDVNVETESPTTRRVVGFVATGTIKRSDYGMIFGIPLIDDTLEITVKTRALTDE